MLMLKSSDGRYLLRQRPSTGIWGGLWSFPELDDRQQLQAWLYDHPGLEVIDTTELSPFRHTFSHYHLEIHPLLLRCESTPLHVGEAGEHWYNPSQPSELGLAAPVKRLLHNPQPDLQESP